MEDYVLTSDIYSQNDGRCHKMLYDVIKSIEIQENHLLCHNKPHNSHLTFQTTPPPAIQKVKQQGNLGGCHAV